MALEKARQPYRSRIERRRITMINFVPKGIIPAMVTPIDETGRINESALRKLTNHLIDGGVSRSVPRRKPGGILLPHLRTEKRDHPDRRRRDPGPGPRLCGNRRRHHPRGDRNDEDGAGPGRQRGLRHHPLFPHSQPEGADRALHGDCEGLPGPADPALLQPRPDPGALPDLDGPGTGRRRQHHRDQGLQRRHVA